MRKSSSSDSAEPTAPGVPLVVAIDDEPGILRMIALELTTRGLRVVTAASGAEGLQLARDQSPDIFLVDIVMPGMSGLEVLTELKALSAAPVILLTARGGDADRARGLALGADDYIPKPFHPDELSARVKAALQRVVGASAEDQVLHIGNIEIDLQRNIVRLRKETIPLTPTEWKLLEQLARRAGTMVSNEQLLGAVWGAEYREDLEYLRIWIARLKRKLEDDPTQQGLIKAHTAQGYELSPPGAASSQIA